MFPGIRETFDGQTVEKTGNLGADFLPVADLSGNDTLDIVVIRNGYLDYRAAGYASDTFDSNRTRYGYTVIFLVYSSEILLHTGGKKQNGRNCCE